MLQVSSLEDILITSQYYVCVKHDMHSKIASEDISKSTLKMTAYFKLKILMNIFF